MDALYNTSGVIESSFAVNPFRTAVPSLGDKLLKMRVVCPYNGTAAIRGFEGKKRAIATSSSRNNKTE